MGDRPSSQHTIERLDNNGHYCSINFVWATRKEQANNRRKRKPTKFFTYNGQTKSLKDWALAVHIQPATLVSRLRAKWSIDRALTTSIQQSSRYHLSL